MNKELIKSLLNQIGINNYKESPKGFNFRCVICGDSKKSDRKSRGWLLFYKNSTFYYCFNCGTSEHFIYFLRKHYKSVYTNNLRNIIKNKDEFFKISKFKEIPKNIELIKEDLTPIITSVSIPILCKTNSNYIKELQIKALKYLLKRKIPKDKIKECFVSYKNYEKDIRKYFIKDRIIIPYYYDKIIYAFQARTLLERKGIPKYITIKGNNDIKIYNFYNVDSKKRVYVTEGPIDSFFLPNAISLTGNVSDKSESIKLLKKSFKDLVFVFDNDETGREKTTKFLNLGFSCFKWIPEWGKYKDINEIVLKNVSNEELLNIINKNSVKGIKGIILNKFANLFV